MTEKVKTVIESYFLFLDFEFRGYTYWADIPEPPSSAFDMPGSLFLKSFVPILAIVFN